MVLLHACQAQSQEGVASRWDAQGLFHLAVRAAMIYTHYSTWLQVKESPYVEWSRTSFYSFPLPEPFFKKRKEGKLSVRHGDTYL